MSLVLEESPILEESHVENIVPTNQPHFVVDETIININPKTFTSDFINICTKYDNVSIINLPHIKFTNCSICHNNNNNGNKRFIVSFGNNIATYSVHNIRNLCRLIKKKYTGLC